MTINPQFVSLTDNDCGMLYQRCLDFLSQKGVKVMHPAALEMLEGSGARVDAANERVTFTEETIERCLEAAPRRVTLAGQDERYDIELPHPSGQFYTSNSTGCRRILEVGQDSYRDVVLADVADYSRLTERLEGIDICRFLGPADVPEETLDVHALKVALENTGKHIEIQPWSFESIPYLLDLITAAAGGEDALRERPLAHFFSCSLSPYLYTAMDVEVIIQSAEHGLPLVAFSLPTAGATSPFSIAGTLLVAAVEVLAQLVMAQLIEPGTPIIGAMGSLMLDMKTGQATLGNIEDVMLGAAFAQFVKKMFRVPVCVHGFATDAHVPGGQAMRETALRGLMVSLAGADILSNAGRLSTGLTVSYEQLIADEALATQLRRVRRGVTTDEDSLGWSAILDVEPGGHYLEHDHTLHHCRDAVDVDLYCRRGYQSWIEEGAKDLAARAADKYRRLSESFQPRELPGDTREALNRIVDRADAELAGRSSP